MTRSPRQSTRWWGRLETRVIAALVLIGTICVGVSAYLVGLTVSYFDARWSAALDDAADLADAVPGFHNDLVDSKIAEFNARGRAMALELALGDAHLERADDRTRLAALLEREVDLVGLALTRPSGAVAEVNRAEVYPETAFEWFDVVAELGPRGASRGDLRAVFRIDPAIDARFQDVGARRRGISQLRRGSAEIELAVTKAIGLASAVTLLIALGVGFVVARTTTRKVGQLSRVMARVAYGEFGARAEVIGGDEIGELARAFNGMLDELASAHRKLAYLQRIGAWQEMARRIAHEIKNPLTPIQLAVQQLRDKDPGLSPEFSEMLRSAVEIVEDEIEGLRRMVSSFSQFAKVPEVRTAPIELRRVLEEFQRAYGHLTEHDEDTLRVIPPPAELVVEGDRQLLKQVLVNLVENAVLSAKASGQIPVIVEISCVVAPGVVELCVDDNGPGIAPEMRERVFEPYETTRVQGSGLGLAIVKKIVLDHGGEVGVGESPLGGARFVIRLRRSERQTSAAT